MITDADQLYHRLFSHPLMVEHLLRGFAPDAMAAGLEFDYMEQVTAKFHADSHVRREGDVIWRLPTANGTDLYLYVMIEFQSRNDWWMAVRTQVYQGLLWQQIIAEKRLKTGDRLPPVLMIVLYNGEPRWSAPTSLSDLIALPDGSPLWGWQPQCRYHLLDMGHVTVGDRAHRESIAALLFRLEQRHDLAALTDLIDDVIGWFRLHPGYDSLQQLFGELVRQAITGVGMGATIPSDLQEMRTMLSTLGQVWQEQWKAEGLAKGRAEGRAAGRVEGRAEGRAEGRTEERARTLLRFLDRRFGPISDDIRAQVGAADLDTLDLWLDRVLDASTIEAVLGETAES